MSELQEKVTFIMQNPLNDPEKPYLEDEADRIINLCMDAVIEKAEGVRLSELALQMDIPAESQELYCDAFIYLVESLKEG